MPTNVLIQSTEILVPPDTGHEKGPTLALETAFEASRKGKKGLSNAAVKESLVL